MAFCAWKLRRFIQWKKKMRSFYAALLVAACLMPAAGYGQSQEQLLADSRKVAGSLLQQLGARLRATLEEKGPEGSVSVCRIIAPNLAGQLSVETGWRIARVSLRTRNPLVGTPDPWEQKVLGEFDRRAAAGETPETLELGEVVEEPAGRYFRYLKAIPVTSLCVTCHGAKDQMSPFLADQLEKEYPHDRATGYVPGQVRGGVTVKRRLD
jgi:hypothetical protein